MKRSRSRGAHRVGAHAGGKGSSGEVGDPKVWLAAAGQPGLVPTRPLLAFGLPELPSYQVQKAVMLVQPATSWRALTLGRSLDGLLSAHRSFAAVAPSDVHLVLVSELTAMLSETTGASEPWVNQGVALEDALDSVIDLASDGRIVSTTVELTDIGFALACIPSGVIEVYSHSGNTVLARDREVDRLKTQLLDAWSASLGAFS